MKKHSLSQLGARAEDSPISWLMKAALDRPQLISLAAGFTDNTTLPLVFWGHPPKEDRRFNMGRLKVISPCAV